MFAVYFVYGLAFFSMGLVVLMELVRIPPQAGQVHLLRPLCVFGFLHSLHEWLEMFLIALGDVPKSTFFTIAWMRILMLAVSFVALWIYGLETYRFAGPRSNFLTIFGRWTLPFYALAITVDVAFSFWSGNIGIFQIFSALTRYLLAVPSAAIATLGLRAAAIKARNDGRSPLDVYLTWAALGFAAYSLTQLFIPYMHTLLETTNL